MNYSDYICNLDNNLFQGSFHATSKEILDYYKINSVLHIGFDVCEFPNKTYKSLALEDNTQSADLFKTLLDELHQWIDQELALGRRVLVACSAGKSRSVSVCLSYLMKKKHMTYDEAFAFMYARRPVINPNPGFIRMLKAL